MKILNRIFVIPMILMLLLGVVEVGWVLIAALVAIPLGFFQILFCLKMVFNWSSHAAKMRIFFVTYFLLVTAHFLIWNYVYDTSNQNQSILIPGFLCSVPVLLALSVTYILEKNLSHENIE